MIQENIQTSDKNIPKYKTWFWNKQVKCSKLKSKYPVYDCLMMFKTFVSLGHNFIYFLSKYWQIYGYLKWQTDADKENGIALHPYARTAIAIKNKYLRNLQIACITVHISEFSMQSGYCKWYN